MLTLDFIIKNKELFLSSIRKRNFEIDYKKLEIFEQERKALILQSQNLQEEKNRLAKEFGALKATGASTVKVMEKSEKVKQSLPVLEAQLKEKEEEIESFLLNIPNILQEEVPEGVDETFNKEIKRHGEIPSFTFTPKEHFELLPDMLDFESATAISGSRFAVLRGKLSTLERALINFCLEENASRGYMETSVPFLTLPSAFVGTGQLPKFEGDFFKTTDGYFLIPTAEVALTNLYRDKIIEEKHLPIRLTSATPCFRSEAGSAGRDTRGLIRLHQFMKAELVTLCSPENSEKEHTYMLETAENILQKLGLCYRVILLCGGDIGFGSSKTYDIEVWLPGQGKFREISSVSNTLSFQATRMKARFKKAETKKNEMLHTLNGSSIAIGRLIAAIMENFQTQSGTVKIPSALHKYTNFEEI